MSRRELIQKEIESWLGEKFSDFSLSAGLKPFAKGKIRVLNFSNKELKGEINIIQSDRITVGGAGNNIMNFAGFYNSIDEFKLKFGRKHQ